MADKESAAAKGPADKEAPANAEADKNNDDVEEKGKKPGFTLGLPADTPADAEADKNKDKKPGFTLTFSSKSGLFGGKSSADLNKNSSSSGFFGSAKSFLSRAGTMSSGEPPSLKGAKTKSGLMSSLMGKKKAPKGPAISTMKSLKEIEYSVDMEKRMDDHSVFPIESCIFFWSRVQ